MCAKEKNNAAERCVHLCVAEEHLFFYLVRDVLIFIQEHFQLANADLKIAVCKLIWNVESEWAELPALNDIPMEKTQRQK